MGGGGGGENAPTSNEDARLAAESLPQVVEGNTPGYETVSFIYGKDRVSVLQETAEALTQAGLGNYSIVIAEDQTDPFTGRSMSKTPKFVALIYCGQKDRSILWSIAGRAIAAKEEAIYPGKHMPVAHAVQLEIERGISAEKKEEARRLEREQALFGYSS